MIRRRRYCQSCGKPLGNTIAECYECGGDEALDRLSREERLEAAKQWKLALGIPLWKIEEAHSEE